MNTVSHGFRSFGTLSPALVQFFDLGDMVTAKPLGKSFNKPIKIKCPF